MSINKQQNSKKTSVIFIIVIIILLAALAAFAVIYFSRSNSTSESTNTENTQIETESQSSATKTENDNTSSTEALSKTPVQNDPVGEVTSEIAGYFSTADIVNDQLVVRITINQQLTEQQVCQLEVTNAAGFSKNYTAAVFNNPSTASCEGFDIPLSELPSGQISITLKLASSEKVTIIAQKEVTI